MRVVSLFALSLAVTFAQRPTWLGLAPDDNVPGVLNLFQMDDRGRPEREISAIVTRDGEYPKVGTLSCLYRSPSCFFVTGVGGPFVEDSLYAIDRNTGATLFKHTLPPGIYLDNLVLDWQLDDLYSVTFDPFNRRAGINKWNATTGAFIYEYDISREIDIGAVYAGGVTFCASTKMLYIGLDIGREDGLFGDLVLTYDLSGAQPAFVSRSELAFPIPSALHAFCNATALQVLSGVTIQADSGDRETVLIGELALVEGRGERSYFFPLLRGDLPTNPEQFPALFMTGEVSEALGEVSVPVYPPFNPFARNPQFFGFLFRSEPFRPGPPEVFPLDYFLAGIAGIP